MRPHPGECRRCTRRFGMLLLRREYRDGAESPEIVLLHAEVTRHGRSAEPLLRFTRTVVPSDLPGRRVAHLPLPEPGEGERILVRYRFSTCLLYTSPSPRD